MEIHLTPRWLLRVQTVWRPLRDAKDELGMGAVFDVAEEDLVGELTEDEALEACGEMGIAVTKGTLATPAFVRGGGGGAETRLDVSDLGGSTSALRAGWCDRVQAR